MYITELYEMNKAEHLELKRGVVNLSNMMDGNT